MRSIYESASRVLIWLGPPSAKSASGFDLMEAIATHWFRVDGSGNTVHKDIELSLDALTGILELCNARTGIECGLFRKSLCLERSSCWLWD